MIKTYLSRIPLDLINMVKIQLADESSYWQMYHQFEYIAIDRAE